MKTLRQEKILEIIAAKQIENQMQLTEELIRDGIDATQSTVSRDIKELRLYKAQSDSGLYHYLAPIEKKRNEISRFYALFADAVDDVTRGQNVVCVKTSGGMAQAVCASLDSMQWVGVLGTLAGEDTIFILCADNQSAADLEDELKEIMSRR